MSASDPPPLMGALHRQQHLASLAECRLAPLLVKAVEKCWELLQQRNSFQYTPPAAISSATTEAAEEGDAAGESEQQREARKAAEEAAAAASMSFEENWQAFLKAVYDTEVVPGWASIGAQLGCGMLQLLAYQQVGGWQPDGGAQGVAQHNLHQIWLLGQRCW